jgi:two-component system alkaline phosphatase synthesis response regulator PhoP
MEMSKILVIDDDPDIVMAVRMTLESAGHHVTSASSGKEGLKQVQAETPDLIILDVMMETHTEGFQLALKLHNPDPASEWKQFKNIPILMLTAIHSTTPLRYEPDIDYLPVELFVDKPINPEDLVGKVNWILDRQKA